MFNLAAAARNAREIPASASQFIAHIIDSDTGAYVVTPVAADRQQGAGTQTVVINNVPVGSYQIVVEYLDESAQVIGLSAPALVVVGGAETTVTLDSISTLTGLAVSPLSPTRIVGQTVSFEATATLSAGTTANMTFIAEWASGTPSVATIDATGTATALAAGSTQVSATLDGVTASTTLTIIPLPPSVINLNPASGTSTGGTSMVITGTNFTGATSVTFGGTPATSFTVDSATQITAIAPAHAVGAAQVVVTTAGGSSTDQVFFTYGVAGPTVTSVVPSSGSSTGGTTVVITGTAFTGATSVTFGGTPATSFTVDSATQITAVTPAHAAGPAQVVVTTPGSSSADAVFFTYIAAPTLVSAVPNSGVYLGGTTVVLTGTGLTGATAVLFGVSPATSFTVDSATQITAVSPFGMGVVVVTVTTPAGTSNGINFNYTPRGRGKVVKLIVTAGDRVRQD